MRVLLEPPDNNWQQARGGNWTTFRSTKADITVVATPLVGPGEADPRRVLERDLPEGCRIEYASLIDNLKTTSGWVMALVTGRVLDANDHEREVRFAAIYKMTLYTGVAMATLPSSAALDTWRDSIRALLVTARPHLFRDEPACIAELFTLEEP